MKQTIVAGLLVTLLPSLAFASFEQNLKYGMNNSDVSQLQDVLTEEGCFTHSSTGYFGLLTLDGVKCFQTKNGIANTGYVGVLTRAALNKIVDSAVASSTSAEVAETGTVAPTSNACPIGFNCTPVTASVPIAQPIMNPTPAPVAQPVVASVPTPTPTVVIKASYADTFVVYNNGTDYAKVKGINVSFSSKDYTQDQLALITTSFIDQGQSDLVDPKYNKETGRQSSLGYEVYYIKYRNLPLTGKGSIEVILNSVNVTDQAGNPVAYSSTDLPTKPAYLIEIKQNADGTIGYTFTSASPN